MSGKVLSLRAKILGVIVVLVQLWHGGDVMDGVKAASFVVLAFSPVDISMIACNILGTRNKGGKDDIG